MQRFFNLVSAASSLALVACTGSASVTDASLPDAGPSNAFWSLTLRDHAINLSADTLDSVTNRVLLEATPRDAHGNVLTGVTTSPVYSVLDRQAITIDSTGMLVGRRAGVGLRVTVAWQIGGVTHSDTAYVNVTDTAPASPLSLFTMQPRAGDSAKWSVSLLEFINGPKLQTARAFSASGQPIPVETIVDFNPVPGLRVEYLSRNLNLVTIDRFTGAIGIVGVDPGVATIIGKTYAYGVRGVDSVQFRVGLQTYAVMGINKGDTKFTPDTLVVGVGAVIGFYNGTTQPIGVYFDNPALVSSPFYLPDGASGNIPVMDPDGGEGRQFNVPGLYVCRDAQGRFLGAINVKAD